MRCAELILERGHGKPAQPQEQTGEKIIPLAERLAYYARRDEIEASGGKVVTLVPSEAAQAAPYVHPRQGYAGDDKQADDFVPLAEELPTWLRP